MSLRLDIYLTLEKLAESRTRAQWMIENGLVAVNGKTITKTSFPIEENDQVEVIRQPAYISRGGYKLEKAVSDLHITFNGKTVLDIGSSTGGFTDYALKHGAVQVTCIDAGNNQLHVSLRQNKAVTLFEHTDIRQFSPDRMPHGLPDIILADLSFISLRKVLNDLVKFCHDSTEWLLLVKPQFEMEQRLHFKNGIVPQRYHAGILKDIEKLASEKGWAVKGVSPTTADGKTRNLEYFVHLQRLV